MLGRSFIALAGGLVVWEYRDSLRDYLGGNAGPARARLDDLLQTVQEKSEVLLDQAKDQLSSRIGSARERIRAGAAAADSRERP